ncbi:hypothetical protein [Mesorhizobium sp.]|uniref:hypothetical protein n=1 Tax=Mesorhizobium sp. TaxID=1871066 RepID=UPI001228AE5E|nr:hypothetical protein [Mesorhizobium sp.]TIN83085.1 MAG: hypothetical protein E5X97_27520 [Mesorhizobium sp.]
MKTLLIMTLTLNAPGYSFDVLRYEVASEYRCQLQGASLAKDILSKIPGVASIHYECVEKGYGK